MSTVPSYFKDFLSNIRLILFNPDGRLKLVCLLDEESCRSCMETNLILNQNVLLNTHCDSLSCK